jgi:hypothetical protein
LFTEVDAAPCVLIAAPPAPTLTAIVDDVIEKFEFSTTAPPPPPCGHQTAACPAPPLLPPPTTNTRTAVTPAGTSQSQLPTVEKVRTVSLPTTVEVSSQLAAFAGTGIETKRLVSKIAEIIDAIFGRAALTFLRNKPKDIFTSLLE